MTQAMLEERLKALEKQVAELQEQVQKLVRPKDWRNVVGMFAGDEDLERIFEAGRKIRERRSSPDHAETIEEQTANTLMILLDSDHLTILIHPGSEPYVRLEARMAASTDQGFATTIVNAEEQLRGWLAEINRRRMPPRQISAYEGMRKYLHFLRPFALVAFDERAAAEFERLRKAKVRIGSMDLKIACIALVHNALLLSANLRDFEKVPDLHVENWLTE